MASTDQSIIEPYSNHFKDSVDNNSSTTPQTILPDYNFEDIRLTTYDDWQVPFINKNTLAKIGFYFLQDEDKVKCHFCKVIIKHWKNGDDPIEDHIKWSPSCRLMRRRSTDNVPIDADQLDQILPPRSSDVCGHNPNDNDNEQIKYPEYRYEINRVHSFKQWPQALTPTKNDFNETGLFYTGNGDKVICFSCGLGLKDWEAGDEPLTEHARWTSGCLYLDHIKGEKFVENVKKSFEEPDVIEEEDEEHDQEIVAKSACVICLANEKQFVFIPCGHMATCGECSFAIDKCPICRAQITKKQRVYVA